MTTRHSSRLTTHLGAIALALAASQAGATTYSVPLQFTLNLTAPVCSLTVGSVTADTTTPVHASGVSVDLTPTPLSVIASPNALVASIPGTSAISADAPGIYREPTFAVNRKLDTPPTASATCTVGTPMVARISEVSTAVSTVGIDNRSTAGAPGAGQSGTLPVGMLMGLASFAGTTGVTGIFGTTWGSNTSTSLSAVATGAAQPIALTAMLHANSATSLTASYAGLWTYSFSVNLDF